MCEFFSIGIAGNRKRQWFRGFDERSYKVKDTFVFADEPEVGNSAGLGSLLWVLAEPISRMSMQYRFDWCARVVWGRWIDGDSHVFERAKFAYQLLRDG